MLLSRAWLGLRLCTGESKTARRTLPAACQVQSTDKNFMVPVGGAIVAGPSSALVDKAGRVRAAGKNCTSS